MGGEARGFTPSSAGRSLAAQRANATLRAPARALNGSREIPASVETSFVSARDRCPCQDYR
eukprot:5566749-Pyramimonas_sp.AAC.1